MTGILLRCAGFFLSALFQSMTRLMRLLMAHGGVTAFSGPIRSASVTRTHCVPIDAVCLQQRLDNNGLDCLAVC